MISEGQHVDIADGPSGLICERGAGDRKSGGEGEECLLHGGILAQAVRF